jgi:uncharacterized membrane protein YtjA (UPF0391 family)
LLIWIAVAALALMIAAGIVGFSGKSTVTAALARIAFAALLIVMVVSIAIYAS